MSLKVKIMTYKVNNFAYHVEVMTQNYEITRTKLLM